ncbi:single-stranded DNA-binding protein [Patescibacteria group bacterium]|nr:single-stranded DNA-binding protein [Patescibacteria group bacterium]
MYINKVFLFGNLTRDPELRSLPSGGSVCSFGLATNRVFSKADGTKQEATEFHNIVVFGRQAETSAQYLKKGSSAFIEGRIQTRTWESPEKGKQYRTEVVAERVQFGPRGSGASASGTGRATQSDAETPQRAPKEDAIEYPQEDINPDDIPF